jgi:hypothetical protein
MRIAARRLAVLASAALVLALAPTAVAQSGNGLYEPFPKAAVDKRAKRFVERLRLGEKVRFSKDELNRGVFVGPQVGTEARGGASARAGVGGAEHGDSGVSLVVQVLLVALAIAALPLLAGRRPRRRVASG